ncbi:kinase-like domain-containing protein [Trichoderma velutinum]
MCLHFESPNQLLNGAELLHPSISNGPDRQLALGEDAWPAEREAHVREALAFEAPLSGETTQPNTESFIESGKATHAGEEPVLEDFSSQLLPKSQPSDETIQPPTGPRAPGHESFISPEEERHSEKYATSEATIQPFTQLCVETDIAREEPTSTQSTTQQLAEAPSPEQSEKESQPFSQPYVLLTDSTDTPEAIRSIEATLRNPKPSDKRKEVKCAEITSVPSKIFQYGYRAETIESETATDIAAIFKHTHTRVPNARLIISHRSEFTKGKKMSSSSAISRPKQPLSGRDTFGVIQRTQDADFTIDLLDSEHSYALQCQIMYQPDSDNCLLLNHTDEDIYLTSFNPTVSWRVCPKESFTIITPGALRISLSVPKISALNDCIFIVDMMLLKKQFDICIPKLDKQAPHRRAINDNGDKTKSTKRRKLENGEAENTISQSYLAAFSGSIVPKALHSNAARTLLDLADGETAIISSLRPNGDKSITTIVESSYQLRRHSKIDETAFSKVFAAWHSEIAKVLVVKIPRYGDTRHFIFQMKRWRKEKTILEKLNHPNVVKLMASDGRILGLYLEKLPQSLFRGTRSPFQRPDALKILHDVASALEYLVSQKIVHNDVKPNNVAYSPDRGAVLLDLGAATSGKELATTGTSWYMPPEFIKTSTRGSPGDIFALGVLGLYLLCFINCPGCPSDPKWRIVESRIKNSPAYHSARNWLRYISDQRAKLNRKDHAESLLYRMLEKNPRRRINAAAIVTELKLHRPELISSQQHILS